MPPPAAKPGLLEGEPEASVQESLSRELIVLEMFQKASIQKVNESYFESANDVDYSEASRPFDYRTRKRRITGIQSADDHG